MSNIPASFKNMARLYTDAELAFHYEAKVKQIREWREAINPNPVQSHKATKEEMRDRRKKASNGLSAFWTRRRVDRLREMCELGWTTAFQAAEFRVEEREIRSVRQTFNFNTNKAPAVPALYPADMKKSRGYLIATYKVPIHVMNTWTRQIEAEERTKAMQMEVDSRGCWVNVHEDALIAESIISMAAQHLRRKLPNVFNVGAVKDCKPNDIWNVGGRVMSSSDMVDFAKDTHGFTCSYF